MSAPLAQAARMLDGHQRAVLVAHVLAYAGTDLLCYRAGEDPVLAAQQAQAWDPWLEWLAQRMGATLHSTTEIMPVPQPEIALSRLRGHVEALPAELLVALGALVGAFGSLVLALAVLDGALAADTAFELSVLDERHQEHRWGRDEESHARREARREDASTVGRYLASLAGENRA